MAEPMSAPMPTFSETEINIRRVIRDTAADLDGIDFAVIADAVVDRVPPHLMREALRQALPLLVRDVMADYRPRSITRSTRAPQPQTGPRRVLGSGAPSPSPTLSGSRKGSEIRDAWQRVLEAPYSIAPGRQKRLGDCGYDDLQYVAEQLDVLAERNRRRAAGFRELAALLTDHDRSIVRDLPADVLIQALGAK